jgi:hypothetical protein
LEFAEAMHGLLIAQARALGVPEDRLARMAGLSRLDMVMALERARAIVEAKNPSLSRFVLVTKGPHLGAA